MAGGWALATVLSKWALYVGALGAAGSVLCAMVFSLRMPRMHVIGFTLLAGAAAVMGFLLKGVALTGDASGMVDGEMLSLLWTTQSGSALRWQLGGSALLLAGLFLPRIGAIFCLIGSAAVLGAFLVAGHVADHVADRDGLLLVVVLFLHLAVAALWIGILTPLRVLARTPDTHGAAADLGVRFGRLASIAVPAMILAGGVMAYALVGSLNAFFETGYGRMLMVKLAAVAALLGLAALNKLRFVPALERGDTSAGDKLARSIAWEWGAVLLILLATALLTTSLTMPM